MDWHEVIDSVEASKNLLEALWMQDEEAVAAGIDKAHREISICSTTMKIRWHVRSIWRFILHGNTTRS